MCGVVAHVCGEVGLVARSVATHAALQGRLGGVAHVVRADVGREASDEPPADGAAELFARHLAEAEVHGVC